MRTTSNGFSLALAPAGLAALALSLGGAATLILGEYAQAAPPKPAPKPAAKAPAKPAARPSAPMAFTPRTLDLAPGETFPVELFLPSPTGKAIQSELKFEPGPEVTVSPDPRFGGRVPGWGTKTFPKVSASAKAEGELPVKATLLAGGKEAVLTVRIVRPGIEPVPGRNKLTVKVTNPFTSRLLFGRVIASNPDRFLQDVTTREFKVSPGQTAELVFPLPGAAPVMGEKYDFTLRVETYNGYRSVTKYPLEFPQLETGPDR